MNILVIGRGGREHAIVWALHRGNPARRIYCAPGNAGIGQLAENVDIGELEFDRLIRFAQDHAVDLVVVGPDDPLAQGIVDAFEAAEIPVYGPRRNAAEIESSKIFMKNLLHKYGIPTARYETFTDYGRAKAYLADQPIPVVIKADGLAAGKGVTVCFTREEAETALRETMQNKAFGAAGDKVVIEGFLQGQEMSILAFVDGATVRPMPPAQDHKPLYDGDQGPNTGGMGTYSPVPHIPQSVVDTAVETIIKPCAHAMVAEGRPFRGVLFAGLMITPDGPVTIEFNARFGDPETQVVLPRLQTDLLDIILASLNGKLEEIDIRWSDEAAVCVVLASGGYPGSYPKGLPIEGLNRVGEKDALVFHAGTTLNGEGGFVTNGGRVLGIVGRGSGIAEARHQAYTAASQITFQGKINRTDIAAKALIQ